MHASNYNIAVFIPVRTVIGGVLVMFLFRLSNKQTSQVYRKSWCIAGKLAQDSVLLV